MNERPRIRETADADPQGELTVMLERWREGDPEVLANLMPLVYEQLHAIARRIHAAGA